MFHLKIQHVPITEDPYALMLIQGSYHSLLSIIFPKPQTKPIFLSPHPSISLPSSVSVTRYIEHHSTSMRTECCRVICPELYLNMLIISVIHISFQKEILFLYHALKCNQSQSFSKSKYSTIHYNDACENVFLYLTFHLTS